MNPIEPIRASISVKADPARAFELFTDVMGAWWPVERYSRAVDEFEGQDVKVERVEFQHGVGGHVLEHLSNGEVLPWAEVLVWEPPSRLVLAWKPNSTDNPPTEVEVRFSPDGPGTLVELEHRGWERLGEIPESARARYGAGWTYNLERFEEAVQRQVA
jgi:uncharacterized protein YndB with AHSA1/START domain